MTGTLQKLQPPALPQGTDTYSRPYQDQLNGVQRLFYNRLTQSYNGLISPGVDNGPPGGSNIYFPYAAIQDTNNKTFTANTATLVLFNQVDYVSGCNYDGTNGIVVNQSGIYNYQFSVQWENALSQVHDAWIWLRRNNFDIPGTASQFSVPCRHAGVNGHLIAAANFFVEMAAGDVVEMYAAVDDTNVSMRGAPAQVAPWVMPSIPSVVATLSFVSNV